MIDTLTLSKDFKGAGFTDRQSELLASAITTRAIEEADVKLSITQLGIELRSEMTSLRADLRGEMAQLRAEISVMKLALLFIAGGVLTILVKVFIP
jgi:hypothetical protein